MEKPGRSFCLMQPWPSWIFGNILAEGISFSVSPSLSFKHNAFLKMSVPLFFLRKWKNEFQEPSHFRVDRARSDAHRPQHGNQGHLLSWEAFPWWGLLLLPDSWTYLSLSKPKHEPRDKDVCSKFKQLKVWDWDWIRAIWLCLDHSESPRYILESKGS